MRELLREVELFARLDDAALDRLAGAARPVHVAGGDWLFRQGEPGDDLYVVLTGRLEVLVGDTTARIVGRGRTVGELALLTGEPRSASVRAVRDSQLAAVDRATFDAVVAGEPALVRSLARDLQASRGVDTAPPRPAVFALTTARAADLADALERFGSTAVLDESAAGDDLAAALDRAESTHDFVLLAPGSDRWNATCVRCADRIVDRRDPDITRVARRLAGRGTALVLSGGGARGIAHLGVLERLLDAGVDIDRVGGCSMGAFVAALHAAGHDPVRTARRELGRRFPALRARRANGMLERVFGDTRLESLPIDTFTVSADLDAGELVVHRQGLVRDAVAASMAIPGLLPPMRIDGRLLVDGGVLDNLPVDVAAAAESGPIIAVDVMRRWQPASVRPPGAVETIVRSMLLGGRRRTEANRAQAHVLITPDVGDIGLLDFDRFDEAVAAGWHAADAALNQLQL